jgi:hypothetical protein
MFYSVLLTNIDVTEYDVLDLLKEKMGFTVNHYDYLRNDYQYHYSQYNNCLVYDEGDDANIISYPLKCCRITAQIYFLWALVHHYASTNTAFTVDHEFSIKFFKCMFDNLGSELTAEKINEVFTDLLPVSLNTTLEYWFSKINTSINITNLFILQHAFELLDYDLELLTKNDVSVFKERQINFEYYTQKLNHIFNEIGKFDQNYKYASDLDWILKLVSNSKFLGCRNENSFVNYTIGGAGNSIKSLNESIKIYSKYNKSYFFKFKIFAIGVLKLIYIKSFNEK